MTEIQHIPESILHTTSQHTIPKELVIQGD